MEMLLMDRLIVVVVDGILADGLLEDRERACHGRGQTCHGWQS